MSINQDKPKSDVYWDHKGLKREERWRYLKSRGATLWFTGLPASGKSTLASGVERALVSQGTTAYRLDGDNLRHGLSADPSFSPQDRAENVRRAGEVAALFADAGLVALAAFVSPYRSDRDAVRATHARMGIPFVEIHVATSLAVCEARDPKGLYRRARASEISGLTGLDAPYEPPSAPELRLDTADLSVAHCVNVCLDLLQDLWTRKHQS